LEFVERRTPINKPGYVDDGSYMLRTHAARSGALLVLALTISSLTLLPAASAQEGDGPSDDVGVAEVAHPCIRRTYHDHGNLKEVHLRNDCGARRYVKVIVAYGPDSGCIAMDSLSNWTFWWNYGWPWAWSTLDRVEWC
jgi:hypothetical protein